MWYYYWSFHWLDSGVFGSLESHCWGGIRCQITHLRIGREPFLQKTLEYGYKALPEVLIHKAVGYRMYKRWHVSQEKHHGPSQIRNALMNGLIVDDLPCAADVKRRPAHEILQDDHKQHSDHPSSARHAVVEVRGAQTDVVTAAIFLWSPAERRWLRTSVIPFLSVLCFFCNYKTIIIFLRLILNI